MSKRMTAIAATALALALGCEEGYGEEAEENEVIGQEEEMEEEGVVEREQYGTREEEEEEGVDTAFDQGPGVPAQDLQARQRAEQQRQEQMRQEQMHQQQMGQQGQMGQQQQLAQAQSAGQVVTTPSERNFAQTISQLQRQMRQNDLEIVGQIRYDERMRQRLMREQQQGEQAQPGQQQAQPQQAQPGQQQAQQGEIGDVRMLVFRRPDAEVMSIESQGAEALLDAPRTVLVYERGEEVIVAYRAPQEMAAVGMEEPTSELLARVVRDATQPPQQPTAQREEQRQEQRAQAGQEPREPVDVNIADEQELDDEERADLGVSITDEDERQARAEQQRRQQAQN